MQQQDFAEWKHQVPKHLLLLAIVLCGTSFLACGNGKANGKGPAYQHRTPGIPYQHVAKNRPAYQHSARTRAPYRPTTTAKQSSLAQYRCRCLVRNSAGLITGQSNYSVCASSTTDAAQYSGQLCPEAPNCIACACTKGENCNTPGR